MTLDPWLVRAIVLAVVIAWLVLTIASILDTAIEVPASLNGLFMTVAGGVVAMQAKGKRGRSSDDETEEK